MVFSLGIVMILVVLVMCLVALGMKDKLPRERLTEADL